jgi:PAS domain S-box-containing protein
MSAEHGESMMPKKSKARKKKTKANKPASLRKRAEGLLSKQKERLTELSSTDMKKLVHELATHQIELEMQNEELRNSHMAVESLRARYADLYDFSPMGYFSFDKDGVLREVNLTGAGMLGSTKRLLLDRPFILSIAPAHRTIFRNHLKEVFRTGNRTSCEIALVRKDGSSFQAQLISISYQTGEESAGVCRTAVSDITERKLAEALRENEELFRRAVEEAPIPVIMQAEDGQVLQISRSWTELTGYALKDVPTFDAWLNSAYGDGAEAVRNYVHETFKENRRTLGIEFPVRTRDGRIRHWTFSASSPGALRDGRRFVVGMAVDITERKRAERLTQASLRMLSMTASPSVSRDEILQKMLDELEQQTGSTIGFYHFLDADQETLSLQAWSTNTLIDMCTAEGKGSHYSISRGGVWVDCVRERRPVIHNDYASLAHRKGLPPGHASVKREMVVPIVRGGRIVAIIGVGNKPTDYNETDLEVAQSLGQLSWEIFERIRAVDELQTAHAEVEQRSRELAAANEELEAFTSSVSHDLRAPLRSVSGFARAVVEDYSDKLDAQARDYLVRIYNGSKKMTRLIDDLLRLSRISRQELARGRVDLDLVVSSILAELRKAAPERDVQLEIMEGVTALADHGLMKIALDNLIGNAWKFTSKTEKARIEFGSRENEGKPLYYIRDNGAGFDPANADKMFRPFQRLHSEKEFEGTGIGLAIVERIVRRHGGKVWAEGEPGKGATVYFTLG